jgi:hypothetical protein
MARIFGWEFIFQKKMAWTRSISHELVDALAHGRLRAEEVAVAVACQSSCSHPLWTMATHRSRGKTERGMRCSQENAHHGLDSGETVAELRL